MKYFFNAVATVSIHTEVDAASEEEALEIAEERSMQSLCWSCASKDSDTAWSLSGKLDGDATDIRLSMEE